MKSSVLSIFDQDVETVFLYLAYSKEIKSWTTDKELYEINNQFSDGKFIGFESKCGIGSRTARIFSEITYFKENEEIRSFSKEAIFENGEKLLDLPTFPYDEVSCITLFKGTNKGCQVIHETYLKPRGLLGWFACKLFVLPYISKNVKNDHRSLNDYLKQI